jgi:Sulfotransferase family
MTAASEPSPPARPSRGRVPDFFIVGHAKCGTTALYEMLRMHPQIFMPVKKEPWFFARNPPSGDGGEITVDTTGVRSETLEDYLSLFGDARADQLAGEASTAYLWSTIAPGRIAEAQPEARIIAIFREPASFVRSLHLQLLQNRTETEKDLRKAIALEDLRRKGQQIPSGAHWPQALLYSERVRYVEQLRRYEAQFAPKQMLVLIYEDFRRDNEGTIRRVLNFLGVDETVPVEEVSANPSVRVRSNRVSRMVPRLTASQNPLSRGVKNTARKLVPTQLRRDVRRRLVFGQPPPPDDELMADLRRRFKGEVAALGEYVDRDLLALWGYESDE